MKLSLLAIDPESGASSPVAQLEADAALILRVVSVVPDRAAAIEGLVARLNGKARFHVEAPPPAGSRPRATYSRIVRRGEDGFLDAMNQFLERYHDLRLAPVD